MKIKKYWSVYADDYHVFGILMDAYKEAGLTNIKYEEIDNSAYLAVFWTGKKPTAYINELNKEYSY